MGRKKIVINNRLADNETFVSFVNSLSDIFSKQGDTLYDARNVIKSYDLDTDDSTLSRVVVKRFRKPNFIQRIVYTFFRKSKAERAFHNGARLLERGISTPENLAYVETYQNHLLAYGYYVTGVDSAPPIRDLLLTPKEFDRPLADAFAMFVARLHEKGILHNDLNSTNVLYHQQDDGTYTFSVIDINRMKFYPLGETPTLYECMDNMTRYCGDMQLFEYVARRYTKCRQLDVESTVKKMIAVKNRHDEQYRRRKSFFKLFK